LEIGLLGARPPGLLLAFALGSGLGRWLGVGFDFFHGHGAYFN
jgi:hypothetical protein